MALAALLGLASSAVPPAVAHPSWGIVVEPDGAVVFTDVDHNTVWRVAPGGRPVALAAGVHSHELYRGADGTLYGEHVAYDAPRERWLASRWRITPAGRFEEVAPLAPADPGRVATLRDAAGRSYAFVDEPGGAGRRLVRREPGGETTTLARASPPVFAAVSGRAWGRDGALYVTDGAAVRRVAPGGAVAILGGEPFAGADHGARPRLLGLAVSAGGRVFVADYDHHLVRVVEPDGAVRTVWSSGRLWAPTGIALAGGALYLLEHRPERLVFLGWIGPRVRVRRLALGPTGGIARTMTIATLGRDGGAARLAAALGVAALAALAIVALRRRAGRQAARPSGPVVDPNWYSEAAEAAGRHGLGRHRAGDPPDEFGHDHAENGAD